MVVNTVECSNLSAIEIKKRKNESRPVESKMFIRIHKSTKHMHISGFEGITQTLKLAVVAAAAIVLMVAAAMASATVTTITTIIVITIVT